MVKYVVVNFLVKIPHINAINQTVDKLSLNCVTVDSDLLLHIVSFDYIGLIYTRR